MPENRTDRRKTTKKMMAAIIGYGKMGREIETILRERGHEVALIIDMDNAAELDAAHLQGIDVALEFTTPATAYRNIRTCIECGTPVVSGTTVPTHYYKVLLRTKNHRNKWVVECSRDELQCIAIMIEHRTYSKGEVPQPSQYESKGLLLSVSELEQMTGLTFFPNVPNAPKDTYNPSDWGL